MIHVVDLWQGWPEAPVTGEWSSGVGMSWSHLALPAIKRGKPRKQLPPPFLNIFCGLSTGSGTVAPESKICQLLQHSLFDKTKYDRETWNSWDRAHLLLVAAGYETMNTKCITWKWTTPLLAKLRALSVELKIFLCQPSLTSCSIRLLRFYILHVEKQYKCENNVIAVIECHINIMPFVW